MILQALTEYYEKLAEKGEISPLGWRLANVSFALELGDDGALLQLRSMKTEQPAGKKMVLRPQSIKVPLQPKRSSGVKSSFLCDNSSYFLGADAKGKPARSKECFTACAALHGAILEQVNTPAAMAVKAFFKNWCVEDAANHPALVGDWGDVIAGGNFIFYHQGCSVLEDNEICAAWQKNYDETDEDAVSMPCLVTGDISSIPAIHSAIKGVRGAQAVGAALMSFNAPAFNSFGREQNFNAPVGEYAAFAYTTALNYLLADREHCTVMGDTTLVCWAQSGESAYQDVAMMSMLGGGDEVLQASLRRTLDLIVQGSSADWDGALLSPDAKFYVLGLSPNAARLSVRFFLQDDFGAFLSYIMAHQKRLEIVRPAYDRHETMPLWLLLQETVNQNARDKSPSPQLAGDMLRAILSNGRYPATLLNAVNLRIRAEREITRGRAALIKAYYLQNRHPQCPEEVLTVGLNTQSKNIPYTLGRVFAILENIQESASPGLNTTIKDKYFNSASASPATIFPLLVNLAQKHLRKLVTGKRIYLEKQLQELLAIFDTDYPQRLTLAEQGSFQLGYYHQTQKRYEKKEEK